MRFIVPLGFLGSQTEHNKHITTFSLDIEVLDIFDITDCKIGRIQIESLQDQRLPSRA